MQDVPPAPRAITPVSTSLDISVPGARSITPVPTAVDLGFPGVRTVTPSARSEQFRGDVRHASPTPRGSVLTEELVKGMVQAILLVDRAEIVHMIQSGVQAEREVREAETARLSAVVSGEVTRLGQELRQLLHIDGEQLLRFDAELKRTSAELKRTAAEQGRIEQYAQDSEARFQASREQMSRSIAELSESSVRSGERVGEATASSEQATRMIRDLGATSEQTSMAMSELSARSEQTTLALGELGARFDALHSFIVCLRTDSDSTNEALQRVGAQLKVQEQMLERCAGIPDEGLRALRDEVASAQEALRADLCGAQDGSYRALQGSQEQALQDMRNDVDAVQGSMRQLARDVLQGLPASPTASGVSDVGKRVESVELQLSQLVASKPDFLLEVQASVGADEVQRRLEDIESRLGDDAVNSSRSLEVAKSVPAAPVTRRASDKGTAKRKAPTPRQAGAAGGGAKQQSQQKQQQDDACVVS